MTIEKLNEEIKKCKNCELWKTANQAVPGEGNIKSDIFFVGEAPGFNEDKEGRPFCGAAGNFLDEMLKENGLDRKDVYITNIVKHRPVDNRDPEPNEIDICTLWLEKQLEIMNPKVVVTLGRFSKKYFLPDTDPISASHGKVFKRDGRYYLTLYHPAAGLHQASLKETIKKDFKNIKKIMKLIK